MPDHIKRLHYYDQQFLRVNDFGEEQNYHRNLRILHNRSLHTWGVVHGFGVTKTGDNEVTVSSGMALDKAGQEIVLLQNHKQAAPTNGDQDRFVIARFTQEQTDEPPPQDRISDTDKTRWTEGATFDVVAQEQLLTGPSNTTDKYEIGVAVILARIKFANGRISGIEGGEHPYHRRLANVNGHFSRDGIGECCSGGDFTLSVAEATRNQDHTIKTGRRSTIQFHNGWEGEGFIRLAALAGSQPKKGDGTPVKGSQDIATRRFIFGSYQQEMAGEFTGDLYVNGNAHIGNELHFGMAGARLTPDQGGSLELGPKNSAKGEVPYIDFHFGKGIEQDYNARIINAADNRLDFITRSGGTALSIKGDLVGLGTPEPLHLLHLYKDSAEAVLCVHTKNSGNPKLQLLSEGNQLYEFRADRALNRLIIARPGVAGDMMAFDPNTGNVGIGTTKPGAPLSVMQNVADLVTGIEFSSHHTPGVVAGGLINAHDENGTPRYLSLQTNGANVGIGTMKPEASLDVNGGAFLGYENHTSDFGGLMKSGFYQSLKQSEPGDVPDTTHDWSHLITARHSNPENNHQLQIAASYKNNDRLFFRKIEAEKISSNPAWHEMATRGPNTFSGDQHFNGNVGVGTTGPDHKLQIGDSGSAVSMSLRGPDHIAESVALAFEDDAGTGSRWFKLIHDSEINVLKIRSAPVDNIMAFARETGNVGIGTTSSGRKLVVDGNVSIYTKEGSSWGEGLRIISTGSNTHAATFYGREDADTKALWFTGISAFPRTDKNKEKELESDLIFLSGLGRAGLDSTQFTTSSLSEYRNDAVMVLQHSTGNVLFGAAIVPSAGNSESSGILFPKDPWTGTGDRAWIRYYSRGGEATTFEIGTSNDPSDHIALIASGGVGIGTIDPSTKLDVNGQIRIRGGVPGDRKILTCDANGLATWRYPTSPVTLTHAQAETKSTGSKIYAAFWVDFSDLPNKTLRFTGEHYKDIFANGQAGLVRIYIDATPIWESGVPSSTYIMFDSGVKQHSFGSGLHRVELELIGSTVSVPGGSHDGHVQYSIVVLQ